MNVLVNNSARFQLTPDGRFWAPSENFAYVYWTRFLDVFDEVTVLARASCADAPLDGAKAVSGPGVRLMMLPNYCGIGQFARDYLSIRRMVHDCVSRAEAVYLSLPCVIGDLVRQSLPRHRPFGVGVCGDPFDALAPGSFYHPLRPQLRWYCSRQLKRACRTACACTYVTRGALQRRYPCQPGAFSTYYSSIHLVSDAIIEGPLSSVRRSGPFHLINVGTFENWYKGPDTLLQAVGSCCRRGLDLKLTFVGGGRYIPQAEKMAEMLGIGSRVRFLGQLPFNAAVRAELDKADLFVFPSRQEGLPKALVEAMARGLPCIASTIGGIPELLPREDMVPPDNPEALASLIAEVLANPERRLAMSARNLATVQEYHSDVLRKRRIEFYQALRSRTEEWLKGKSVARLLTAGRV